MKYQSFTFTINHTRSAQILVMQFDKVSLFTKFVNLREICRNFLENDSKAKNNNNLSVKFVNVLPLKAQVWYYYQLPGLKSYCFCIK